MDTEFSRPQPTIGGGGEGRPRAGAEDSATDVQPRREALINQMLELEDNEDLDNLEL